MDRAAKMGRAGIGLCVIALVGTCVSSLSCAAPKTDMAVMAESVGKLTQEVAGLSVKVGGDVNEPVTGWIMAVGLVLLALTYPVGKMIWMFTGHMAKKVRRNGDPQQDSPTTSNCGQRTEDRAGAP